MKEKIKLVIVFIIGILISVVISVYATTVIGAGEVSYTPGKVSASNVQDAIDGVYTSANTLATNVNNLTTRVTNLEKHGCFTYTGTTDTNGNLTVTHNKNLGTSYYPIVMLRANVAAIAYTVTSVSTNSFTVAMVSVYSYKLAKFDSNTSVTITWCY